MGDSLTAGRGAIPITQGDAYLLYQQGVYDTMPNTSFANAAIPGATSQQVLNFQVPSATQTGFSPQVIAMTVGGNDLLAILNGVYHKYCRRFRGI
jgi:lysophospholipase L1-like esterase